MAERDAQAFGSDRARHRGADRHLRSDADKSEHAAHHPDRARSAQSVDADPAAGRPARGAAEAVLRSARPARSRATSRATCSARSGSTPSASRATSRSASSTTNAILRFLAVRTQTYASNSHIFLLWMVGSSVILLTVAILFLRNQIRPILRLAEAADAFGKGRPVGRRFPAARRARGAPGARRPSSRCATASSSTSSSAPPCSPASATICAPC